MRFTFHPNEKGPLTLSYHAQLSRHHANFFFVFSLITLSKKGANYTITSTAGCTALIGLLFQYLFEWTRVFCMNLNDQVRIAVFRNQKVWSHTLKLLKLNTPFLTLKSFFKWRAFSAARGCNFYTSRVKLDQILSKYYISFHCVSAVIYLR